MPFVYALTHMPAGPSNLLHAGDKGDTRNGPHLHHARCTQESSGLQSGGLNAEPQDQLWQRKCGISWTICLLEHLEGARRGLALLRTSQF